MSWPAKSVISFALPEGLKRLRNVIIAFLFVLLLPTPQVGQQESNRQPNRNNGQSQPQKASEQPSGTSVQESQVKVDLSAEGATTSYQKERDAKEEAFKAEQLRQNRIIVTATVWIAVLGGLSLLASLIYAVVSIKTLRAVKKQADHAGEQVGEMQKTVAVMTQQADVQHAQLATMNQQADVMKRQLEAMAISERAYLSIEDITINPIKTHILTITADIVNAGRTPAFNLTTKTQTTIFRYGDTLRPPTAWDQCPEDKTASMLAAGGRTHLDFAPIPGMTQQIADFLNSGHSRLFIDAQCRYVDFIGKPQILEVGYVFEFEDERSRAVMLYQTHREEAKQETDNKG